MILPWVGCVTLVINACLSWYKQDTPYFPIEMSKIANNYPQYYIFVVGMCITAYRISQLPCRSSPLLPFVLAFCLVMLAILSDQNHWLVHVMFATSFFLLACWFFVLEGALTRHPWWTVFMIGFVALEKLLGLMLIVLYGKSQENEGVYVIYARQFKGFAQWCSIVGLMVMVSLL